MKRKKILGLMLGLLFSSTFLLKKPIKVQATTVSETVKSPNLKCSTGRYLEKGDSSGVTEYIALVDHTDNKIDVKLKDVNIASDEKLFVVGINKAKNQPLTYNFFDPVESEYSVSIDLPNYCDLIDLHIYKQKSSEPNFTLRSENFIGRTKVYMTNVSVYKRNGIALTSYDKNGAVISEEKNKTFLNRITPNYYSLQRILEEEEDGESGHDDIIGEITYDSIGKIVLPDSQKNLMSEDEKIIPIEEFKADKKPEGSSTWDKAVTDDSLIFNFYLPKEVTEFKFIVYKKNISDKTEDILYQYNIKLNRK